MWGWWLTTALVAGNVVASPDPAATQELAPRAPRWQLEMSLAAPMTTTDPNHVGVALGISRQGLLRAGTRYQPSETSPYGFIHAAMGVRARRTGTSELSGDFVYTQVWAARQLFRIRGFQFEGHDRRQLYIGIASLRRIDGRRWWNLVESVEVGGGRLHVRELVSGRAEGRALNAQPVSVLKSVAPVGMLGVSLRRPLKFGLEADARIRVYGAGRSRGGVVPFAQATAEWTVSRPLFQSPKFGRGTLGLSGVHATHAKSPVYYQNSLGVTLRIAY
ncbi:MAG: hypothetical protein AB7L71_16165 [Vicinamibacterales bacterium]|jgi:hypothetical protein